MPTATASTADEIADTIKALVDRMVDAKFTKDMTQRGQDVAEYLAERGGEIGNRAATTWKDSRPARRNAAKQASRAGHQAAKWSEKTWRRSLRPAVRDLWKRRTLAIGAAGAAVPAGKELVEEAAVRLGLKQREERHWGAFFLGLLIGAAIGAIAALMAAPKPGRQIRRELGAKAGEVRDEIATRARESEWVPLFQRQGTEAEALAAQSIPAEPIAEEAFPADTFTAETFSADTITEPVEESPTAVREGASESDVTLAEAADTSQRAADEAAEAINEAFEPADTSEREPQA